MRLTAAIRTWGEMIRFSHSVFALPFALVAAFLAGRQTEHKLPTISQLGLIVLCMVAARSFAMTFNRIADAAIDARNPRTAARPLPTGRISGRQAWFFLLASAAVFTAGCAAFRWVSLNPWPAVLCVPSLLALAGYSYAKRITVWTHFALGAVIGFAPMAAWIAVHPASLGWPALLLAAAVSFWIAGFDIIYACQDVDMDRRERLHAIPARYGIPTALLISRLCHLATAALLVGLGFAAGFGWVYWVAIGLTAALLTAEQAVVSPADLSRVNLAFFTINGCVSLLFAAGAIVDLLLKSPAR